MTNKSKSPAKSTTNKKFKRKKNSNGQYIDQADKPLTKQQIRLVKEFLMDPNKGKFAAYKRAGYKGMGPAGRQSCSRIFNMPNVKKAVDDGLDKMRAHAQDEVNVTFAWVMKHLKVIVDFDIREIFDEEGKIIEVWRLSDTAAMALSNVEMGITFQEVAKNKTKKTEKILKAYVKKVKHYDKLRALELIIELMGFKNKNENEELSAEEIAAKVKEGMMGIWDSVPLAPVDPIDDNQPNKE